MWHEASMAFSSKAKPRMRAPRPAGSPPSEAKLREAAIAHLAKFSATEAGLARVLGSKMRRWAHAAQSEGQDTSEALAEGLVAAKRIAAAMVQSGVVDDAGFAAARMQKLARGGRSRRATAAHLAAKGIGAEDARTALEAAPDERDVALAMCRKRRIGPFSRTDADAALRLKWLGILARAGFSRDVAQAALRTEPDEAEERILALRS